MKAAAPLYSGNAHSRLRSLYRRVDESLGAPPDACRHCSDCCIFSGESLLLCASELELDLLFQSDPGRTDWPTDGACPFHNEDGCSCYEIRPLGCRAYQCHQGWRKQLTSERLYTAAYAEVAEIARTDGREAAFLPALQALKDRALTGSFRGRSGQE